MNENQNEKEGLESSGVREPFFIVPNKVFGYGLNPYELSVLFYLLMRADNKTHTCFPNEKGISDACGTSLSTIKRTVKSLEEKEVIKVERQFAQSKNGLKRQTSNLYTVVFCETPPIARCDTPPMSVGHPPQLTQTREINITKPNITKSNITKPTELNSADAEAVAKERNSFLSLKEKWLEQLRNDYLMEEEFVLLLERSIESLWSKRSAEYDGVKHQQNEIRSLILNVLNVDLLVFCVRSLEDARDTVRSPLAYLSKCLLGAILHPESALPFRGSRNAGKVTNECESHSTFDVNEFFEAALRRSYGEL